MGVRGLTGFCKAKEDTCGVHNVDLSKKTLVIDMDSFLHYACEQVALQYAPFSASWTLLGGDHRALYVWVQEWMKKFFRAQIRLKFIRDPPGRLNSIKDVTSEKRSAQRAEKAAIVRNGIFTPKDSTPELVNEALPSTPNDVVVNEDSDAAKIATEAQSVFPMARATLVRCIQHAGVSLITTSFEADEALGKMVRDGKAFAVLAQDSDYLLMRDVLYIPFPKVVFGEDGSVRAYVYSANKVAETLGIPNSKLIEVALVCGNDFTPYLERHFDFAAKVNLPTLRQTQGFSGILEGVEWLERQFGGTNWLDDPSFQVFLKGNSKALSYVYSVYSFYGAGDQILSRYPNAERESNLAPSEWKKVIKLLDKHNFPNFALDVLYCQERHLSSRFISLWRQPLVMQSNSLLYHALGQTSEVLEYYSEAIDESHSRKILPSSPDGKKPIPITRILLTSKEKRRTTFQRNVLSLLQSNQQLHDSVAKWKGSKSHYELQLIANALALTLASSDENLHQYLLPLLLTSVICKALQKQYMTVPLQAVANQAQIEFSCVYRWWIDWQLNHLTVFGLASNLNPHAFFSAGIFSCVTSLVPPQVYSKQQVNRVVRHFFNDDLEMIQLSSWSYWMLAPLFEPYQPPPLALQVLGSASKQQIPAVVAKKMARSKKKTVVVEVEKGLESLSISSDSTAPELTSTPTPPIEREPVHIEKLIFTLPVFAHKDEILDNIAKNSLTIIQGETGCGKSTSVPQFILNEDPNVNVYITQPRRVAAITLASTVAKMRGESVGGTIGYRVGQYQHDSKATRITYATTGYMLERIIHMPESMNSITHIILDEAHERSMDMDLLLLMIKTHWHMWPQLRLIIMSATMDAAIFFGYFKKGLPQALVQKKPLFVGSALYDVTAIYMDEIQKHVKNAPEILTRAKKLTDQLRTWRKTDLDPEILGKKILPVVQIQLDLCVALALYITKTTPDGSCILIFLPGISDIQYVHEQLERIQDIKLFVLHSDLDIEDQEKAFAPVEGKVKIILSTNIAESSVTIPDVTHIINSGMEKQIVMPSTGHMEVLVRSWCSKASVKQRSGRAGRIRSGVAYHLFTKAFMNECMTEYTIPELLRKPLDKVVLQLKSQLDHVGTPTELLRNAMSVPDLRNIAGAYKTLYDLSAVTEIEETTSNQITPFGDFCTNLPLDVRLCRLLMYSLSAYDIGMQNGLVDTIIIVCILASPDLHISPSHFHSTCAQKYMNEMKYTLESKMLLQQTENGHDLWSEPLAMWQLVIRCLKKKSKGAVMQLLREHSISVKRFQTMCVLMGDICLRFIRLTKRAQYSKAVALQPSVVSSIVALERFCTKGFYVGWKHEHTTAPIMRLLLLMNYPDSLVVGRLLDVPMPNTPLIATLNLDETSTWAKAIPNDHLTLVFEQAVDKEDIKAIRNDGKYLSILFNKPTEDDEEDNSSVKLMQTVPLGMSLLHYIRDRSFPIDFSTKPLWEPSPDAHTSIRCRMPDRLVSGCSQIAWKELKSGIKVRHSARSPLGLPFRTLNRDNAVFGIFAEQLLTGDGSNMMCSKGTLLPPQCESYLAILMLLTAKRSVWLYLDKTGRLCMAVKVDGENYLLPQGVAMLIEPILSTVNKIRKCISYGLTQPLPTSQEPRCTLLPSDLDALFALERSVKAKNVEKMTYARNRPGKGKVKVSRKSKPRRKYKTKFVGDAEIKKQWDHKLTTRQNYENIGLCQNPNSLEQLRSCTDELIDPEELFDVPDSDILNLNNERNPKKGDNHMSEMEMQYLRPLVAKYGEDFTAMARDIKINNEQWTAAKLKRRCARMKLMDAKIIK